MARGLMTALQAALAGVSGGAAGYARYQEDERKRLREEKEAEERQALNLAGLYERGFKSPEQLAQDRERAGMAGARLFSAMKGSAPLTGQDVNALSQAAATQGPPAGRISYGGQDLVLPETQAGRTERLGMLEDERNRLERGQAAEAEQRKAKDQRELLQRVLDDPSIRKRIPAEFRAAVAGGMMTLPQALSASGPRGGAGAGGGTASRADRMRDVENRVASFIASNTGKTRRVKDPETYRETDVPIDVMREAEALRANLMRVYGLSDERSIEAQMPSGGGARGLPQGPYFSDVMRDRYGPTVPSRTTRPYEFTTSSGRTYRLPEE